MGEAWPGIVWCSWGSEPVTEGNNKVPVFCGSRCHCGVGCFGTMHVGNICEVVHGDLG